MGSYADKRASRGDASASEVEWLIVGLGNPGPRYRNTPHNVGFDVIERLGERHRIALVGKHKGMFGIGPIGDVDVALLMPLEFMNLSGQSVRPAAKALRVQPAQVLVVHDEVDLEFGVVRIKSGGGLAGHNGLRSIEPALGTRDFQRVRIGVGRPGPGDRRSMADWILAPWDSVLDVDAVRDDGVRAAELVIAHGVDDAMNSWNGAAAGPRPG